MEESAPAARRSAVYRIPGIISWSVTLFAVAGVVFFPAQWMIVSIVFLSYFVLRMVFIMGFALLGEYRRTQWEWRDWTGDQDIPGPGGFAPSDVWHVAIVPNYTEPDAVLERTLDALARQHGARERLMVVLGMEAREPGAREKGERLAEAYRAAFARVLVTVHPANLPGEEPGKGSNEAWAAIGARDELERMGVPIDRTTVTSCDADSLLHPDYLAALSQMFAHDRDRYRRFWQAPMRYVNNIWRVPAPIRFTAWFGHIGQMAELSMGFYPSLPISTYSLSFQLLEDMGGWDPAVISEDWHAYLRAHFHLDGDVKLVPVYLPTHADCADGDTWIAAMRNRFEQVTRHSWGAEDAGYCMLEMARRGAYTRRHVARTFQVTFEHVIRVVAWVFMMATYILALGAHPAYGSFVENYVSGGLPGIEFLPPIFAVGGLAIMVTVAIEIWRCPPVDTSSKLKVIVEIALMWWMLPFIGLYLGMLPALRAQTRLMLGRPFSYTVTPKRIEALEGA